MATRRKSRRVREPLSRERIVNAALELIESDGLQNLSLRRLGAELEVEAMSLYHHFPSKAHLLDALVDRILADLDIPATGSWEDRLRASLRSYRRVMSRYPNFAVYLLVHRMNTPPGLAFLDRVMLVFKDAGFEPPDAARVFRAVGYYVMGAVLDETAGYARGPSTATPLSPEEEARRFPNIAEVGPYFKPLYLDVTFETGLTFLIEGIRREAQAKKRTAHRSEA